MSLVSIISIPTVDRLEKYINREVLYMDLSKFTTPRINYWRENLNLTDDELVVFNMLAKKKPQVQIAAKLNCSISVVANLTSRIRKKIKDLEEEC